MHLCGKKGKNCLMCDAGNEVTADQIRWCLRGFNPIHTIDEAAEQVGLPGVNAHGMLTMATKGHLFTPYLDRGFIQRFYTRFAGMVFVGDVLTIGGKVVKTIRRGGEACLL